MDKFRQISTEQLVQRKVQVGFGDKNKSTDILISYIKTRLSDHSKRRPKNIFQDQSSLNAGQKYCRMQYFQPSLSYHPSLRALFCLFLSGHFRQVLLYILIVTTVFICLLKSDTKQHKCRSLIMI